jgi:hypothetical protein
MRPVAAWLVGVSMVAAPALAGGRDGQYDPCRNRGTRRIAVVYTRSSGLLGREGKCEGNVYPDKKTVCVGDTIQWSVINACDVDEVADIRIEGLERVAEKCTAVRRVDVGGAKEIQCRLKRTLGENVKQPYEVKGRIGKSSTVIDPELDIRRPN